MQWQDIVDLTKTWGSFGPVLAIPGLFGVGSQTYGNTTTVSKTRPATKTSRKSSGSIGTKIYH
jgi:hypothetical protein